jgi:flagellar basal-body rod protein FlgB
MRMDLTNIGLFNTANKRLSWLAERQSVLASNIANVNTPDFKSSDVESFSSALQGAGNVTPTMTQAGHMAGTVPVQFAQPVKDTTDTRSVDGNAVNLDSQLVKVADTESDQSLVTSVWKSYVGMFNTALGKA